MSKILPTFLGIGAHKAGTTWLYEQMKRHPEIWLPPVKELHYFDRSKEYLSPNNLSETSPFARLISNDAINFKRNKDGLFQVLHKLKCAEFNQANWWFKWTFGYFTDRWYKSLFNGAADSKNSGEITPAYSILNVDDIKKIKRINPNLKLIFLIRNPIERQWSSIRFNVNRDNSNVNLKDGQFIVDGLKKYRPGIDPRGNYEKTIENYLKVFDSSQMLICFYDAIKEKPVLLLKEIFDFLGVLGLENNNEIHKNVVNASPPSEIPKELFEYLSEIYSPMISRLSQRLGSYAKVWEADIARSSKDGIELYPTVLLK